MNPTLRKIVPLMVLDGIVTVGTIVGFVLTKQQWVLYAGAATLFVLMLVMGVVVMRSAKHGP